MNRIRQWWHRRRARKNRAAQPVLTFDALLERAELRNGRVESEERSHRDRPTYLPSKPADAFLRIVYSIGGGACFWGAVAIVVLVCKTMLSPFVLLVTLPLLAIAWRLGFAMEHSLIESGAGLGDYPPSHLRMLLSPIAEPLVLFIGWAIPYTGYALERMWGVVDSWFMDRRSARPEPTMGTARRTRAMQMLPDALREIIATEQYALIGGKSELCRLILRADAVTHDARRVRVHFDHRVRDASGTVRANLPEYLVAAHARAHAVVERLEARQRELEEQRKRIVAFYDDCLARADALRTDVDDLTLFRQLQHLEREDEAIADAMYDVIARSSTGVLVSAYRFRELLSDVFLETGVATATATLDAPDAPPDFSTFEATIGRFVERAAEALPAEPDVLSPHTSETLTA